MEQKSKNAVLIIGGADGSTSFFIVGHSKKQPLKIRIKNSIYRYKCQKERLILQHEPELLGEIKDIPVPDFSNEASVKEYFSKINTRSEMIAEMPDSIIPMDFHLYKIGIDDDFLEMEIDYTWNIFEMSYSGNKKVMKRFKKIARDLYSYYVCDGLHLRKRHQLSIVYSYKCQNFLNEDRHTHNIAVLMNGKGDYAYCPIFDNGAGLLADTTMDYPLSGDVYTLMDSVQSKTISSEFDEQLDISESLYKINIRFQFTKNDVTELLEKAVEYPEEIRNRVEMIIFAQMRKYNYLFSAV